MKTVVDTTVFTDVLLKTDIQREAGRAALKASSDTLLPVYAIKEFKAGPLHNYVWYHNKVVEASGWQEAITVIRNNLAYRKYMPATALQAVGDFMGSLGKTLPADVGVRYPGVTLETALLLELRIWLKQHITRAWRRRRKITTTVMSPLSCYFEKEFMTTPSGQLDDSPLRCEVTDCCLRERYRDRLSEVKKLESACTSTKPEVVKRRQALKRLRQHPTKAFEEDHCRALGDAVFALDCPAGGEILTTNVVDHEPLAAALKITVRKP
jgi:hypothetical protein